MRSSNSVGYFRYPLYIEYRTVEAKSGEGNDCWNEDVSPSHSIHFLYTSQPKL